MFQLERFTLQYPNSPQAVLTDISLCINAGEKVALLGPSGAGKTSLLNALYQQQPAQIAWCPQEQALVDVLSGYHNIYMGQLERHSAFYNLFNLIKPFARHKQAIRQLAKRLGVEEQLWKSVSQLSGGQRQRVGVGRALYRQQDIFLGDEPVSSLDPIQAQDILQLIVESHQTVVVALHNREQALQNFDRIIGVKASRIVFDKLAAELQAGEHNQDDHSVLLDQLYA